MDRHLVARGVVEVEVARQLLDRLPARPRRSSTPSASSSVAADVVGQPAHQRGRVAVHEAQIVASATVTGTALVSTATVPHRGSRRSVQCIDWRWLNAEPSATSRSGAAVEEGVRGPVAAGVAEHAERQLVVLGERALGQLRRGDGEVEALGQLDEQRPRRRRRRGRTGEQHDASRSDPRRRRETAAPAASASSGRPDRRSSADGRRARRRRRPVWTSFGSDRWTGARSAVEHPPHGAGVGVVQQADVGDAERLAVTGRSTARVVERAGAGVLEEAEPLDVRGHLAAEDEQRDAVGQRRRHRRDGVGQAGSADHEARAEAPDARA